MPNAIQTDTVRGLGVIMRAVARHLNTERPMTPETAAVLAVSDAPYCMMVLMRLEMRDIATRRLISEGSQYNLGFTRGPRWMDAARVYGWKEDESAAW